MAYFLEKELELLKESHFYRQLPGPLEGLAGPRTRINGQEMVLFSSNNYLGLSHHPRVKAATVEAVERWGDGKRRFSSDYRQFCCLMP